MTKSSQPPVASSQNGAADRGYRKVIAFQKADLLAKRAYDLSESFRRDHGWLASQLVRAAISAPLNIVEGHSRGTTRDFLKFLETANSSLAEVEYLLEFLRDVELISAADFSAIEPARKEAAATLFGLIKSLRRRAEQSKDWNRNLSEPRVNYGIENEDEN